MKDREILIQQVDALINRAYSTLTSMGMAPSAAANHIDSIIDGWHSLPGGYLDDRAKTA